MPLDSAQVQADPFLHVTSIIKSHLRWMAAAITDTCSNRAVFRLEGHPAGSNTFILDNYKGAREAAVAFVKYHISHPPPKSLHAFQEAVKSGSAMAAKAGILFAEINKVFQEATARYERACHLIVMGPGDNTTGFKRIGPLLLTEVWATETFDCEPLFQQLGAFSIHGRSAVVPPPKQRQVDSSAEATVLSDRQNNILQAMHQLGAFDQKTRRSTAKIAEKTEGKGAAAEGFKGPIADLKRRGLIGTRPGRGGGCWLLKPAFELLGEGAKR